MCDHPSSQPQPSIMHCDAIASYYNLYIKAITWSSKVMLSAPMILKLKCSLFEWYLLCSQSWYALRLRAWLLVPASLSVRCETVREIICAGWVILSSVIQVISVLPLRQVNVLIGLTLHVQIIHEDVISESAIPVLTFARARCDTKEALELPYTFATVQLLSMAVIRGLFLPFFYKTFTNPIFNLPFLIKRNSLGKILRSSVNLFKEINITIKMFLQ